MVRHDKGHVCADHQCQHCPARGEGKERLHCVAQIASAGGRCCKMPASAKAAASSKGPRIEAPKGPTRLPCINGRARALGLRTKEIVEIYHDLSENFLICDRWFNGVPAGT